MLLRKGVYPYEYMEDLEKLKEASLPEKEDFNCHLSIEDITDADYMNAKQACIDFETTNFG